MKKTQAMRALENRGISYTAIEYDASRAFHSADEAATLLGVAAETVFKTLVVLPEIAGARALLVVAPSTRDIDLKAVARATGHKRLRMASQKEAERLTGLQVGGISALALLERRFDVLLDASARSLPLIHVSAGQRGVDVALAPVDFAAITGAQWADTSDER
jgi:Cys-tRNA(Pro)/Cys-tRNA(Cys) deacylase